MSNSPNGVHDTPDFLSFNIASDFPGRSTAYTLSARRLAQDISARAAFAAKLITRELKVPRHAAFDALARAGGFADWQHLTRRLANSEKTEGWQLLREGEALVPLACSGDPDPDGPALLCRPLHELAEKLSHELNKPVRQVLDRVAAALLGETSWAVVEARMVASERKPLYYFVSEDKGPAAGGFHGTRYAHKLMDELPEIGAPPDTLEESARVSYMDHVAALEKGSPDFMEGGWLLAELQAPRDPAAAFETASRHVRGADALIPRGFKGRLSERAAENRTYFRLLRLQARLAANLGKWEVAVATLRKLGRRATERKDLEERWALPYLLLLAGDEQGARRASERLPQRDVSFAWVALAFAAFACGDSSTFRRELLKASSLIPGLRELLTLVASPDPEFTEGFHEILKGGPAFNMHGLTALHRVPGLLAATLGVLNAPEVRQALDSHWARFLRLPDVGEPGRADAVHGWLEEIDSLLKQPA